MLEEVRLVAPRSFGHLAFEDCLVPESSVLGRPGQGFVVATDLLERFRMTVGAAAVGFARRAVDSAVQRARERRIHGGRLTDLQLVKGALADMEIKLNYSAMLVVRAAWELDHGNPGYAKHSSIAESWPPPRRHRRSSTLPSRSTGQLAWLRTASPSACTGRSGPCVSTRDRPRSRS